MSDEDEDEPQIKLPAKEGEWSSGLRHLNVPPVNPVIKKFQKDYSDAEQGWTSKCYICGKPTDYMAAPDGPQPSHPKCRIAADYIEPHKGNRAQRALLLAARDLEVTTQQLYALATEYGDPNEATVRRIEDVVATRIAQSLREKPGEFQMTREAIAEWIEEGKWRG